MEVDVVDAHCECVCNDGCETDGEEREDSRDNAAGRGAWQELAKLQRDGEVGRRHRVYGE